MLEHGIEVPQEWIISDRDMECGVVKVDIHPDQMKDMPTAFVYNSDLTASMVINQLEEQGYRVPEDFSVVGFDNYLFRDCVMSRSQLMRWISVKWQIKQYMCC